jgi:hypothetical protein
MALTGSEATLSSDLQAKLDAEQGAAEDATAQKEFTDAMSKSIVPHFISSTVVTGSVVIPSGSSAGTWPITGALS